MYMLPSSLTRSRKDATHFGRVISLMQGHPVLRTALWAVPLDDPSELNRKTYHFAPEADDLLRGNRGPEQKKNQERLVRA